MIAINNRRDFLKSTAALGAGYWVAGGVAPRPTYRSKLDRVRFACIGVGGKGSSDLTDAARLGDVLGICDIDGSYLDQAAGKVAGAKKYFDYRQMLDELADSIDAVTVSTPDHTHAVAALHAMRMGKHCFCQKPLTHSIEESRMMSQVAREHNLMTQMGNQFTADSNLRQSAALIKAGVIGTVKEVHVWTNRPVWPQGDDAKTPEEAIPDSIKWDLWIGPAEPHPFSSLIHPFKWRGLWKFGTGALGDMACHTLNMSFMALNLRNPTSVVAESSGHNGVFYPKWSKITFEFPELDGRPALKMFWYDGDQKPLELMADLPRQPSNRPQDQWSHFGSAALLVGDKGMFYSPGDYGGEPGSTGIVRDGEFTRIRRIERANEVEYERSPGHFEELVDAITGKRTTPPVSNFPDYAGPLTETNLLGNLAVWASGTKIEWNAESMEITSNHSADQLATLQKIVRKEYHNGFEIHETVGAR
ncbi:MAG TPA: Gfo/Idh/MocA family oxidoreductase [Pirellulaceae bacterium]|nr:Gfo/Idh/MocA family oxidoreductase [Pirellulaceae bacterium]HMO92613.1 Gfo/Idh/MocA family oxidoreductase [Pirellulaceae bacterium]HMP70694.1 Gfo/Idh/MocA family oxidoreductase [Pirellulaceae bacterium]